MDVVGSEEVPFRVGILALPGFALLSYACTVEPLRAANLLSGRALYDVVHFGQSHQIASSGVARISTSDDLSKVHELDLLIIVAGGAPEKFDDAGVFNWLQKVARKGVPIGGVSGGPVIMAKAGIVNGRRMTVHWEHSAYLSEMYPDLAIERRLYLIDRDRVTCGGGTAALDLMHALISDHQGAVFARQVSDWFLHTEIRAATGPQLGGLAERLGVQSPRLLDAVAAMEDHIADPLNLSQLAQVSDVSPRQINRLFQEAFGTSTMAYYRRLRLDVAMRLVRGTSMAVREIADACGFSTAAHLSQAFSDEFGASPGSYRRPF